MRVRLDHQHARVPTRATEGSAGYDLYACEAGHLAPGAHGLIPIGVAVEIPFGWYGRIAPRSGLAVRYGINVHAGVVDSDYRAPLRVAAINHGDQLWEWRPGERVAQLVVERCYLGQIEVVGKLSETERGVGGFGSSGR